MHKPWHSLVFTIILFLGLSLLSFTFPKEGIKLTADASLNFPSLQSLFETKVAKKDISKILAEADALDTATNLIDTTKSLVDTTAVKDTVKTLITSLQYKNKAVLKNFFDALSDLKSNPKSIRVLHYGDSQIEGDRITDYLRLKLQALFGGSGVGLISLMPVAPSISTKITYNNNWDRYGVFVFKDKRVKHNNFGPLAGFNRFSNYRTVNDSSGTITSDVKITTTKLGGSNTTNYKKVKLFYGGSQTKTWCEFYDGPALVSADSLNAGGYLHLKEYNVGQGSLTHEFKFKGKDSPDFYGVSLETENGVFVDNIGLRGSSGTFFHQINFSQLKQFYDYLNVKLVILQFGGNVMPGIKNEGMATNYANYLRNQISIVKKAAPNASIIFIGPADMSVKEGTEYVTHPYLEATRDAIKKVALESDCAFFDMYDCMGGKNSMPTWVEQNIAATDYIHFSPQGARKIATLFYSSLINEYNNYLKSK
jgi:lysophospholipase L1-like esterase